MLYHQTYLITRSLSSTRRSNQHDAVSDDHGLVQLNNFLDAAVLWLQSLLFDCLNDHLLQFAIVVFWQHHPGEQIRKDALKWSKL